jgi:hypothetical protein
MAFYAPPTKPGIPTPTPSVDKVEHLLEEVTRRLSDLDTQKVRLDKLHEEYLEKLEKVSGLTREQARDQVWIKPNNIMPTI